MVSPSENNPNAEGILVIMKQPKSKLANLLSLNQHRKRLGAAKVANQLQQVDWETMSSQIIEGDTSTYTHGSDKNLQSHIDNLRHEFVGRTELEYYHASLTVLIRRDFQTKNNFNIFEQLWYQNHEFLINNLNTRWLISACDTFIDHSDDDYLISLLMNAVIMVNTIKLQESELFLTASEKALPKLERKNSLEAERLALFDGVSGFAVGTDDTLRNMRWRLDKLCNAHVLGGIVLKVFESAQHPDANTVYSRFRALHTRDKTAWWTE